jgi:hypothetical protein
MAAHGTWNGGNSVKQYTLYLQINTNEHKLHLFIIYIFFNACGVITSY